MMKYGRTFVRSTAAAFAGLLLTGCVTDGNPGCSRPVSSERGIRMELILGEPVSENLQMRSAATTVGERAIKNMAVLVFDGGTDLFKEADEIDESEIGTRLMGSDGDQTRFFTCFISPNEGDRIVVLANYRKKKDIPSIMGPSDAPESLEVGVSTSNDINSVYACTDFSKFNPSYLPMSGETFFADDGYGTACMLIRSVAKAKIVIDPSCVYEDPYLDTHSVSVFTSTVPLRYDSPIYTKEDYLLSRVPEYDSYYSHELYTLDDPVYLAEFPGSVYAVRMNGSELSYVPMTPDQYDPGRPALILAFDRTDGTSQMRFYRLDFAESSGTLPNANSSVRYLDIERNTFYTFTVKHLGMGYYSFDDAVEEPGSNVEYTVEVDAGEVNRHAVSNGQYALCYDQDTCVVYDGVSAQHFLNVHGRPPEIGPGLPAAVSRQQVYLRFETADGKKIEKDVWSSYFSLTGKNGLAIGEIDSLYRGYGISATPVDFFNSVVTIQYSRSAGAPQPAEPIWVRLLFGNIQTRVPVKFAGHAGRGYAALPGSERRRGPGLDRP